MAKQTSITLVRDRKTLQSELTSDKFQSMLSIAGSKYIAPDKIVKIALLAATRQPKLLSCTLVSVKDAIIKGAELGLDFGGLTGQGYLVPYGSKNLPKGVYNCNFIPGYQGFIEIAYRTEKIDFVDAEIVYEADSFEYSLGSSPYIEHKPNVIDADRGKFLFAYCVVIRRDSKIPKIEIMRADQIESIRSRSRSKDDGPWVTDTDEMRRKTVVRRAWKYFPKTPEIQAVMEADNQDYTFDEETDIADAEIKNTMGRKKVDAKEVTDIDKTEPEPVDAEVKTWRCSDMKCGHSVVEQPKKKQGKLQCPKCLKLTMQLVVDEDFMED